MLLGSRERDRWTPRIRTLHRSGFGRTVTAGNSLVMLRVCTHRRRTNRCVNLFALSGLPLLGLTTIGCVTTDTKGTQAHFAPSARTAVVAPVLNLSANSQVDPLKLTDAFASELASLTQYTVIPVNLALAALAARGKGWIDSPADALQLAHEFQADGTFVLALTEYDPYDPPVVGLILQWYPRSPETTVGAMPARLSAMGASAARQSATAQPAVQVQRVFNAGAHDVLEELRVYADSRTDDDSALKWRKYAQSQELYMRYCSWSLIRSMERVLMSGTDAAQNPEIAPGHNHEHGSSLSESGQGSAPVPIPVPGRT